MGYIPLGSSVHGDSPGKNTGVGCHVLLQGIFPIQGTNPGVSHCRWILYHLNHQGSPRILEWVAIPSLADLPDPGIEPGSPALQVYSLPTELSGKPWNLSKINFIKESKDAVSSTTDTLVGAWFTKATKNFGSAAAHSSKQTLQQGSTMATNFLNKDIIQQTFHTANHFCK